MLGEGGGILLKFCTVYRNFECMNLNIYVVVPCSFLLCAYYHNTNTLSFKFEG